MVYSIIQSGTFYPILFDTNNVTPVGITHNTSPVSEQNKFQVTNTGVYEISWFVTLYTDERETNDITLDLVNLTTSQSLLPPEKSRSSFTYDATPAPGTLTRYLNMSGSIMVNLAANDIVDLEVSVEKVLTAIESASFNIKQIA